MLDLKDQKAVTKKLLAFPFGFHYDNVKWVEQNGWIVPRNNQTSYNASNEANVLNQSAEARRYITNANAKDWTTRNMKQALNRGFVHLENIPNTRRNELGVTVSSKGVTTHVADIQPGFIPPLFVFPEVSQIRGANLHHPPKLISSYVEDVSLFSNAPYRQGEFTTNFSHTMQKYGALNPWVACYAKPQPSTRSTAFRQKEQKQLRCKQDDRRKNLQQRREVRG